MEYNQILELVREVSNAGLSSFEYKEGDVAISMSCPDTAGQAVTGPVMPEGVAMPAPKAADEMITPVVTGKVVTSPLVGTFYEAPEEGTESFVKVGDCVKPGQTLAIVEAMKLMNEIECEYSGTIAAILVENGQMVEYGQPLFEIKE